MLFPIPFAPTTDSQIPGATLHDWYIGQALLGLCANSAAFAPLSEIPSIAINIGTAAYKGALEARIKVH